MIDTWGGDVIPSGFPAGPVEFAIEALGFSPDSQQASVLTAPHTRGILCCSRQWGKSTTVAAMAVYHAVRQPDALILIASPSARQSGLLLHKCAFFLARLGSSRRGDGLNRASLLLPNRARIVALPNNGDKIRGFSAPSLIIIDEAARVPDSLYFDILPMLAACPNGRLWLLSTPNGKHGFFHDEWMNHDNGFFRLSVPATACPRIKPDFLAQERARLPLHLYEQEYLCAFHSSQNSLIPVSDIEACYDLDIPEWSN
ncbi:MAG: hypothetical protein HY820_03310 [Acidobacteria bacterium]|nr:hypothetical protein [Acidobacteriota bacterium]